MIQPYSENVPIFPGEYILNALARGNAEEIKAAVLFLGAGDIATLDGVLERWVVKQGHTAADLAEIINARRLDMKRWKRNPVDTRPHWADGKEPE